MTMRSLLSVHDLTVVYPRRGDESLIAVRSASFGVEEGEILALLGVAGSGKSTALAALAGLLPPRARVLAGRGILDPDTSTEIDLLAARPSRRRRLRRSRLAMLPADPGDQWNPGRTLRQHLRETVRFSGRGREWRREERWLQLLYDVGLIEPEQLLDRLPRQVSPLVRMRVRLAMALLAGADLWLLDDATAALDATAEDQVLRLLRDLVEKHRLGLVFATTRIPVVERVADRAAVFYEGGIVEHGRTADLLRRPKSRYTRALLDCLPHLGERRHRLGEIDRVAEQDAIDATRGIEG